MMMLERQTDFLSEVPAFEAFTSLVAQNIQIVPELKLDESGFTHRIQIFDEPDSSPRVLFSKRALARYKAKSALCQKPTFRRQPVNGYALP
jgi:hypothetical protein